MATMVVLTAVCSAYHLVFGNQWFRSIRPDLTSDSLELVNQCLHLVYRIQDSTLATYSSPFLSRLIFLPFRLQPPHSHFPPPASARYCTQRWSCVSIPRADRYRGSRDRRRTHEGSDYCLLGTSPVGLAESSSLSLRTGLSSQVALHLSSRKRSYHCRIQGGNVTLTGTSTLLIKRLQRRTRTIVPNRFPE